MFPSGCFPPTEGGSETCQVQRLSVQGLKDILRRPRQEWAGLLRDYTNSTETIGGKVRSVGPCAVKRFTQWQKFMSEYVYFTRKSCYAWWQTGAGKTALMLAIMKRFLPRMLPDSPPPAAYDPTLKIVLLVPDGTHK